MAGVSDWIGDGQKEREAAAVEQVRAQNARHVGVIDQLLAQPAKEVDDWKIEDMQARANRAKVEAAAGASGLSRQQEEGQRLQRAVQVEKAKGAADIAAKLTELGRVHGRLAVFRDSMRVDCYLKIRQWNQRSERPVFNDPANDRDVSVYGVREDVRLATGIRIEDMWFFGRAEYQLGLVRGIVSALKEARV